MTLCDRTDSEQNLGLGRKEAKGIMVAESSVLNVNDSLSYKLSIHRLIALFSKLRAPSTCSHPFLKGEDPKSHLVPVLSSEARSEVSSGKSYHLQWVQIAW